MSEQDREMGLRMHDRRKELHLTQEDVAHACSITKSTVSRYEKGLIQHPHLPTVEAIAKTLRISAQWLLTGRAEAQFAAYAQPEPDVRQIISELRNRLLHQEGLMFDGVPLSAEALQSIVDAMDIGLHMADRRQREQKE